MKQWIAFWLLGLIWGSSFLLIKIAVEDLGTLPLVAARVGIAAVCMAVYLVWAGYGWPGSRRDAISMIVVGIFNVALPFSLITRAEESIDSSLATVLNSSVPLFSLVIAHFALQDEKLNRNKIIGMLVGYVGILILMSRGLSEADSSPLAGQAMMIAATISYACAVIFMRARLRHVVPIKIAGYSLIIGALIMIPLAVVSGDIPALDQVGGDALRAILVLGVVNTVIAYFLFYHLIGQWGARATMVTYAMPPIGITLGALFLDEPIDIRLIFGALLILGGIVAVNYKGRAARGVTVAVTPPQPASRGA
jgi:drug/metabolite transporter (DMT)-like permease